MKHNSSTGVIRGSLAALAAVLLLSSTPSHATDPPVVPRAELPFPWMATGSWSDASLHLIPDAEVLAALEDEWFVRFVGVPVPTPRGVEVVNLELRRIRVTTPTSRLVVNGRVVGGREEIEAGFTAWGGAVAGEDDSDVFLAFSRSGARGWIARTDGIAYLNALAPEAVETGGPEAVLIHESDPLLAGFEADWTCFVDDVHVLPEGGVVPEPAGDRHFVSGRRHCEIAVETDYQYFTIWNDLQYAQDYAMSMWSAISLRYEDQVNTLITLPYLGLYDDPNDPWTAQGGGSGAMLDQFRSAWSGNIPAGADLAHFMSGAGLGGGVAYVDVLCSGSYGFAVSGNINGTVSFPVPTSAWFTWDFFVCAHETGHNFGSWHTHDYCPPFDECAAGPCTGGGICTPGTIMSYCHGCPGGMSNILTYFHDGTAAIMTGRAASASCLDRAPCAMCDCLEPYVALVWPGTVSSYDPEEQWVDLLGCNFYEIREVAIDGLTLGPEDFSILYDHQMSFRVPLLSRLGDVDFTVTSGFGTGEPATVTVEPPPTPRLGVDYESEPWVSRQAGLPLTVGASPGDLVLLCYSPDPLPSSLPGIVDLEIGNGFTSLDLFWTFVLGDKAWEAQTFPLTGVGLFTTWYLQGGVLLSSTGTFPLETTDMREIRVGL